jgi:predicted ATPase
MSIHSISLKNFKSIQKTKEPIEFHDINILIGPNGSGKSNLISFFKLLNNIMNENLQGYVAKHSGLTNSFLYFGEKKSPFLEGRINFLNDDGFLSNAYMFRLVPSQDGRFIFENEYSYYNTSSSEDPHWFGQSFTLKGAIESGIPKNSQTRNRYLKDFFRNLRVFHFHDTSSEASVKKNCNVNDNRNLQENASNLAAFLYRLASEYPNHFNIIEKTIQSVAPFFNRFDLMPDLVGNIYLKWLEKGSDAYRDAHYFSDGTLRFICLATLLLQPKPPATIIIDEPELGLHPSAIDKLAGMIQSASEKTQVIVSTQSVNLLSNFQPDDVIVVEREDNQSIFKRLENKKLEKWLEEYTLGELWYKNVIGGKPQ